MPSLSYPLAFVAGFLTFFATCLLPVLPVYIGYLGGLSIDRADGAERRPFFARPVFVHSLLFVLGFLIVFSSLGLAATFIGRFLAEYRDLFRRIGAVLLVILGISMLDVIRIPFVHRTYQLNLNKQPGSVTKTGAFLFGMTFGFAWTPCIGPVLATLLFLVSRVESLAYGASLLAVFALGLGSPFLIVGALFESLGPRLRKLGAWSRYLTIIFGAVIIATGVALYTDHLAVLSAWSIKVGGSLVP